MNQISPANDSTANGNDLVNTSVTATNSPVGAAAHFDGGAKFEKATSASLTLASNITMSAWVKYTAPSEAYNAVIEKQSPDYVYSLFVKQTANTLAAFWYDNGGDEYVNGGGTALSIGVWTHVTATWDSSTIKTFLNGSANQSKIAAAASWTAPDGVFSLGRSKFDGGRWFKGDLDEVRISSLPRSADWVWAEWKNMASPMVFNAYGNMMGGVVPVLDAPTATDITTTTATLGANVTSDGGSAVIQRGTLWGPATDPTGNSQAADLGTGTGVFTHERTSLDPGTKIYYRGYAENAVDTAYSPSGSFYTEPANQAPSVSISDLGNTSMKISWTTGNGAGRIVLVKANSAVDTPPSDGIDSGYNTATTVFGSCPEIGTGNRVVYKGNTAPNEVTVTSLSPNTTYHVAVYEYAGSGEDAGVNKGINYRTDTVPTASDTTLSGTVAPTLSSPTVTAIGATTATLGATVEGDGGAAVSDYGVVWSTTTAPDITDTINDTKVAAGTTPASLPATYTVSAPSLPPQTRIYYRGYAVNSEGTAYSAEGSFYTEPETQASGVTFASVTHVGMRIQWTDGGGDGRIVLVKAGSAVTGVPADGTEYAADPAFGGSGSLVGDGRVVYKDDNEGDSYVDVTGLSAGTTYHVAVFEYAGSGDTSGADQGINYKGTPATSSQTTDAVPTLTTPTATAIGATGATLGANVTSDNGDPVTARGTVWGASENPTGNPVAEGGTGTGVFTHGRTGFPANTKVYYRGYAVNTVGTAYSPNGSFYAEPSAQASAVTFSNVKSTSMTVSWTAGTGGAGRIVLVKAGSAVDAEPADGTDTGYSANPAFGSGTEIGTGNRVVFKGSGTSVNLTGLTPLTVYHVAAFEYAGSDNTVDPDQGINYLTTTEPARNNSSSSSGVQYWDRNNTTAGSGNDGGVWSTSAANWNSEASGTGGTLANWLSEDAVFSAGTDGIGSLTVTVPNDIAANNVTIEEGTITLDVANTKTLTFNAGYTLAGASGLAKAGAGTLTLGGVNLLTGGISISAGTLKTPNAVTLVLGNNAITLSGGTLDLTGGGYLREFSGSTGTINPGNIPLYLNTLNDGNYSGTFANGGGEGTFVPFHKTGPATQTFQSALTASSVGAAVYLWRGGLTFGGSNGAYVQGSYAGRITMLGGILTLDESTADIDRMPNDTKIYLSNGGGVLRYLGQSGTPSAETVGDLNIAWGSALVVDVRPGGSAGTATLTFNSQSSQSTYWGNSTDSALSSIVNFTTTGTLGSDAFVKFATAPTLVNNVVMRSSFANGTDIATYDATKGVIPFNAVGGSSPAYVAAASAVATDAAYLNANLSLSADTTWSALKIDGPQTIDLNNHNLRIGNTSTLGSLIVKTGAGLAEIKSTDGGATEYLTQHHLDIYVNSGTLKITAPLSNPNTYWLSVNKAGAGLLWLAPTANWSDTYSYGTEPRGLSFSDGAIRLNPNLNGLGTASCFQQTTMVLAGGVMELDNMSAAYNPTYGTGAANLLWKASGGFAAYGSDATFRPNIAWNAANQIPDGAALLLNSTTADKTIYLGLADGTSKLNLGTDAAKMFLREINVADNPNYTTDLAEIRSQIISDTTAGGGGTATYTYPLVKTGSGILILSHNNNTYSGATYVKEGTLLVNGTLATPASNVVAVNPDYSAVTVMSGGTLGGTGTINRSVNFQAGSKIAVNATAPNPLTVNGSVTLSGSPSIEVVNGPLSASSYTILTATSITGTFDAAAVPAGYKISYTSTTVTLAKPGGTVLIVK